MAYTETSLLQTGMAMTLLMVVVSAVIGSVFFQSPTLSRDGESYHFLRRANRLATWSEVERRQRIFSVLVLKNFGYGRELWALAADAAGLPAMEQAVLIVSPPAVVELERFCLACNVSLVRL